MRGVGCNYSSFEILLLFEKKLNLVKNNKKSGTISVFKLHDYVWFMLDILNGLRASLQKSQSFKAVDKMEIYEVN